MEFKHIPVLLNEVLEGLDIKPKGVYLDCTIGGGGHSYEILKRLKGGKLVGFDRDEMAIEASRKRLKEFKNVEFVHSNYKDAPAYCRERGLEFDGILIDLGISSPQIDMAERGFSILHNGRLDMRMDREQTLDAFTVVNTYPKEKLIKILYDYGEEKNAKAIVDKIVAKRKIKPIETTFELKETIEEAFPKKIIYERGNVSQQTFQAIRIEVNDELSGLDKCIRQLVSLLKPKGRIAIISFHSLEDRVIKSVFKGMSTDCICPPKTPVCICGHRAELRLINKKPITASPAELEANGRSASAKLRIAEKIH